MLEYYQLECCGKWWSVGTKAKWHIENEMSRKKWQKWRIREWCYICRCHTCHDGYKNWNIHGSNCVQKKGITAVSRRQSAIDSNVLFLYSPKSSKSLCFSDFFRGYIKVTLVWNDSKSSKNLMETFFICNPATLLKKIPIMDVFLVTLQGILQFFRRTLWKSFFCLLFL